jgi:hypothetical protein
MGTLNDIVSVTITNEASTVQQAGFGVPLILSHSAGWVERVREYSSLTEVQVDFVSTRCSARTRGLRSSSSAEPR